MYNQISSLHFVRAVNDYDSLYGFYSDICPTISYAGFFRAFVEQFFKEIVLARWVYDGR